MPIETETLDRIAAAYETKTERIVEGVRCFNSTHIRYNLEGALIDMDRTGKMDEVCRRTINRVIGQLAEIERALKDAGLRS